MLVGPLRTDARRTVRIVLGLLLLGAVTAVGCWGLLSLRDSSTQAATVVTVLAGSALTLGFAAAPLIGGATDPLDPRRFTVLGMSAGPLAAVLGLAGLVSVPIAAVTALGVCIVLLWQGQGVPWPVGTISVILSILICSLLARVCMALAALFLRERRSRELTGLFVLALLVVVVPVGVFLASLQWGGHIPVQLAQAADILGDTPIGAAWAVPARWADDPRGAVLSLVVALATVLCLAAGWAALVHRVLHVVERPAVARGHGGLGWFAVTPGTPSGAIAARSLLYWLSDRRYLVNILIIPVAGVLSMVPLLIVGVPLGMAVLLPVPIMALFLGWLPHNDLAYDSTAVWLHIASGVRGLADRWGRLVPVLVIGVPLLAVTAPVAIALHERWSTLPVMIGVCTSLFLGGLGLSSVASAVAPYPVTRPGDSPFRQPERSTASGAIAQGVVLAGALVVSAPAVWWGWRTVSGGDPQDAEYAFWSGIGAGVAVLLLGLVAGAVAYSRRGSRLLEAAEAG